MACAGRGSSDPSTLARRRARSSCSSSLGRCRTPCASSWRPTPSPACRRCSCWAGRATARPASRTRRRSVRRHARTGSASRRWRRTGGRLSSTRRSFTCRTTSTSTSPWRERAPPGNPHRPSSWVAPAPSRAPTSPGGRPRSEGGSPAPRRPRRLPRGHPPLRRCPARRPGPRPRRPRGCWTGSRNCAGTARPMTRRRPRAQGTSPRRRDLAPARRTGASCSSRCTTRRTPRRSP